MLEALLQEQIYDEMDAAGRVTPIGGHRRGPSAMSITAGVDEMSTILEANSYGLQECSSTGPEQSSTVQEASSYTLQEDNSFDLQVV